MKNKKHPKKGHVIWLTGLPCSGKTTLSKKLESYLKRKDQRVQILDGDAVRKTICKDLGFSKKHRDANIERIAHVSQMLSDNGVHVIVAFVSPYQKMRDFARSICRNFHEIHVMCDLNECIKRDVKGMYKLALEGKIKHFTGIHDPYENPKSPELILETDKYSLNKCFNQLKDYLEEYLPA